MKETRCGNLAKRFHLIVSLFVVGVTLCSPARAQDNRFEKNVQAYEATDKTSPPPKGAILLVGDSQFYRWKTLSEDLPDYTIINRGIDSFQFPDILFFFDRLV